jgi:hypothetical protein
MLHVAAVDGKHLLRRATPRRRLRRRDVEPPLMPLRRLGELVHAARVQLGEPSFEQRMVARRQLR